MKTRVGLAVALMTVILLVGCSLMAPKSFEQGVAYADGTLTGVLDATSVSLDAHQISSDDAKAVRTMAQNAAHFSDAAKVAGDTAAGKDQLALATAVLTQLQTYLNERSKK